MSDILYDLIFKGDLAKGVDLSTAKKNIKALFKIDDNKVDVLFSGKSVTLKKGLNFDAASKYRVAIKKAGAIVEVAEQAASVKKPTLGKAVFGVADSNDAVKTAETAASNIPKESSSALNREPISKKPANTESITREPRKEATNTNVSSADLGNDTFDLAPVGADVLNSKERKIEQSVELNLSEYALSSQDGNLVDAAEIESDAPVEISISGDISIANAGEDILSSDQKYKEPELNLDLSEISLAEPGATIVKPTNEEAVSVDISHLSLTD